MLSTSASGLSEELNIQIKGSINTTARRLMNT
jgi:hypothetical protein